jgi:hypothetical protein
MDSLPSASMKIRRRISAGTWMRVSLEIQGEAAMKIQKRTSAGISILI